MLSAIFALSLFASPSCKPTSGNAAAALHRAADAMGMIRTDHRVLRVDGTDIITHDYESDRPYAPYLLEPIAHVKIHAPGTATSRVTSAISSARGRVLDMSPREGWSRWDTVEATVPEAELCHLANDLRSSTQGMATFETRFDHLSECTGKVAEQMIQRVGEPA